MIFSYSRFLDKFDSSIKYNAKQKKAVFLYTLQSRTPTTGVTGVAGLNESLPHSRSESRYVSSESHTAGLARERLKIGVATQLKLVLIY